MLVALAIVCYVLVALVIILISLTTDRKFRAVAVPLWTVLGLTASSLFLQYMKH